MTDFPKDLEDANDIRFVRRNNPVISINLEKEDLKHLRLIAQKKSVRLNALVSLWIKERLRSVCTKTNVGHFYI